MIHVSDIEKMVFPNSNCGRRLLIADCSGYHIDGNNLQEYVRFKK